MTKPVYLVVTPFFPSPSRWQGAYVLDQVKAIIKSGRYKVIVFTPCHWRRQEDPYVYDGVKVLRVRSFFMPSYFFNGIGGGFNGKQLIQELHEHGINLKDISVVHCHTASFACFATALKKINPDIKSVLQYHDPDPYQIRNGKLADWKPNAIFRAQKLLSQFKYIDLHLCISEKVKYNLLHFPNPHPNECFDSYQYYVNFTFKSLKINNLY